MSEERLSEMIEIECRSKDGGPGRNRLSARRNFRLLLRLAMQKTFPSHPAREVPTGHTVFSLRFPPVPRKHLSSYRPILENRTRRAKEMYG